MPAGNPHITIAERIIYFFDGIEENKEQEATRLVLPFEKYFILNPMPQTSYWIYDSKPPNFMATVKTAASIQTVRFVTVFLHIFYYLKNSNC